MNYVDLPKPLPNPLIEMISERFRVIGEPMRIRLLDSLREGPATVNELVEATGASQQNVSKHLNVLYRDRILSREKVGTAAKYAIVDPTVFEICELVCGQLIEQTVDVEALLTTAD